MTKFWTEPVAKNRIFGFPHFLRYPSAQNPLPKRGSGPYKVKNATRVYSCPVAKQGGLYTTKGGIPIQHLSDIHYSILQLLAECGWVSQPLLELTGYSYTYRSRCLKTLLDSQYIRKRGQGPFQGLCPYHRWPQGLSQLQCTALPQRDFGGFSKADTPPGEGCSAW